jgi:hypothetical protein
MANRTVLRLSAMLHLMVDTSTWLDLAKRRDGQKWIVAVRLTMTSGRLRLLVPPLVVDEFRRNRPRIEISMTASVTERFRQIRRDFNEYGGEEYQTAIAALENLAHQVPLIGAMTTRNFDDVLALLNDGLVLEPTDEDRRRVVQRALDKQAPFHRSRNSVADALLLEMYASTIGRAELEADPHGFVTSNSEDFSLVAGDRRRPHEDLAEYFRRPGSAYWLGVDGMDAALRGELGDAYDEVLEESDFREDPRRLDEILEAESELFDQIWYVRSLNHDLRLRQAGNDARLQEHQELAGPARRRVEERFGGAEHLGSHDDFQWGMLNGKLSALRWVLGSDWDFLDT